MVADCGRSLSGISVERCGQHGTKTVGGRVSPIRGCYHKTGEARELEPLRQMPEVERSGQTAPVARFSGELKERDSKEARRHSY